MIWLFIGMTLLIALLSGLIWRDRSHHKRSPMEQENFAQMQQRLTDLEHSLLAKQEASAIATRTQMMAHDVRKPFSLLKIGVEALAEESNPQRIREIARQLVPSVTKALAQAEHMINDVMELGHDGDLHLENISPDSLIELTISSVFKARRNADVSFSYDFKHQHRARVDSLKIHRLMSNIVENALEATHNRCAMWFKTCEIETADSLSSPIRFIEFTIGNSNSFIPTEDCPKVFDSFYTKGKKAGTGLGLAVAQKITAAHGGEIFCRSHPNTGTEFVIRMPASDLVAQAPIQTLPKQAGDISFKQEAMRRLAPKDPKPEMDLEEQLADLANAQEGCLRVLLVDDHTVYLTGLNAKLLQIRGLKAEIECFMAATGKEGIRLAKKEKPHLIICDVDFGPESPNGFEIVKEIRSSGSDAVICMHSNHDPSQFPESEKSLADGFLAKPMSRESLYRLMISALTSGIPQRARRSAILQESKTRCIAFVDDCPFTRDQWENKYTQAKFLSFDSPEAFLKRDQEDPDFLASLSGVVTDYYFDNSSINGSELARFVKSKLTLPVVLCTDSKIDTIHPGAKDDFDAIDHVIPKAPPSWRDLTLIL